jgi:hypothetical protein
MQKLTIGLALLLTVRCAAAQTTQPTPGEELECSAHPRCPQEQTCFCDDAGNVVREVAGDEDGDGRPDSEMRMTYDAENRLLSREVDVGADGTAEWRETYSYDESGSRSSRARDQEADGRPDVVWHYAAPCPPPYEDCEVTSIEEPTSSLTPAEVAECYAKLDEWREGIQRNALWEWGIARSVLLEARENEACTLQSLVPDTAWLPGRSVTGLRVSFPEGGERLWSRLGLLEEAVVIGVDGREVTAETPPAEFLGAVSEPGRHEIQAAHMGRERQLVWIVSE